MRFAQQPALNYKGSLASQVTLMILRRRLHVLHFPA